MPYIFIFHVTGERQPERELATNSWSAHFCDGVLQVWLCYAWPSAAQELAAFAVAVGYVTFTLAKAIATNDSGWIWSTTLAKATATNDIGWIRRLTFTLVGNLAAVTLLQTARTTWVQELQGEGCFEDTWLLRSSRVFSFGMGALTEARLVWIQSSVVTPCYKWH